MGVPINCELWPAHVEIIRPCEKLSPDLGGTGYLDPLVPATRAELLATLPSPHFAEEQIPPIWKVDRSSVIWKTPAVKRRKLYVAGKGDPGPCPFLLVRVVGGNRRWFFVAVDNIADSRRRLSV